MQVVLRPPSGLHKHCRVALPGGTGLLRRPQQHQAQRRRQACSLGKQRAGTCASARRPDASARPARVLRFCADSGEELRVTTWTLTGLLVFGIAMAALSEVVEGRLPADSSLLPNFLYSAHAGLQSLWHSYGDAVYLHPIWTCAGISCVSYGLGDLLSQTLDSRQAQQINWRRVSRSAVIGLTVHGPLCQVWYEQLDRAFFLSKVFNHGDLWWLFAVKILLDQTLWAGSWNLCFFCCQGVLRLKSPGAVWQGVQRTWWPLLKGGWRVWPLVLFTAVHMLPRSTLAI